MVGPALEGRPTEQRHRRPPAGRLPSLSTDGKDYRIKQVRLEY
jgi:hypothetical protein